MDISGPTFPRPTGTTRRRRRTLARGLLVAGASLLLAPSAVSAHPLGNFTTNHYDGVTVGSDRIVIDDVLDLAEIPAYQARQHMDRDGDGEVSTDEAAHWAEERCERTTTELDVRVDGRPVALEPTALGVAFAEGQGGLLTLRSVCTLQGAHGPLAGSAEVSFRNLADPDRLGWREIVVAGDGVTLVGAETVAHGGSERLTAYPDAAAAPVRNDREVVFSVAPGGPAHPAAAVPDAVPMGSPAESIVGTPAPNAVPGGIEQLPEQITTIIQARDLSLPAIVLSLVVAMGVGALHAASPGHGKTLMAAYLVGTRGTVRHALGLGLTVTVSHTIGVLALGAIVVTAGSLVSAERLFPVLGLVSGVVVTVIGMGLLAQRVREQRVRARIHATAAANDHGGRPHPHDPHVHGHGHDHDHAHAHGHDHDHARPDGAQLAGSSDDLDGWHAHGPFRHTHLPHDADPLRWRNLAALGLVGGLVPSASAILILVGSIAAGRPVYGMALTVAFGFGMALVLVGVGVLLVRARGVIERWPRSDRLAPVLARMPLVTAIVFVIVGAAITIQAGIGFG